MTTVFKSGSHYFCLFRLITCDSLEHTLLKIPIYFENSNLDSFYFYLPNNKKSGNKK